jgi:hypothetical protein
MLNHERDKPHSRLVEFCHTAAAAILETFSEGGHDTVESTVVDTHFNFAETVDDPDELCLCLLESMSSELDQHLLQTKLRLSSTPQRDLSYLLRVRVLSTRRLPVLSDRESLESTHARRN